ncbi:hypothetical protein J1614_010695 [Plenodomus biglobosus]|nr:hypothetical protein J1614_010695 [Plenodomus biglobosus]
MTGALALGPPLRLFSTTTNNITRSIHTSNRELPSPPSYTIRHQHTPFRHTAIMPASVASSTSIIVKPKPVACGESCDCCGCDESCWCIVM